MTDQPLYHVFPTTDPVKTKRGRRIRNVVIVAVIIFAVGWAIKAAFFYNDVPNVSQFNHHVLVDAHHDQLPVTSVSCALASWKVGHPFNCYLYGDHGHGLGVMQITPLPSKNGWQWNESYNY